MSELSKELAPVINKALLANGVQLTHKELGPVSTEVAAFVRDNFEAVTKVVQAEVAATKKQKQEAEVLAKPPAGSVVPPPAPPAPGGKAA